MVHIRFLAASGGAKGGAAIFLINVFLLLQSGCPYIFGAGRQLPPFNHCLLLLGNSCSCSGSSGFPPSLSEWSFTLCPTWEITINKMCWAYRSMKHFLPCFPWFSQFFKKITLKKNKIKNINMSTTTSDCHWWLGMLFVWDIYHLNATIWWI